MTMTRGLLVFLAICAFAYAMVPRDRRAVNTEEEEELLRSPLTTNSSTTENGEVRICAHHTPCAWTIYNPNLMTIEMEIINTYCNCSIDTKCQVSENEQLMSAYVHKCRAPGFKPVNVS